MHVRGANATSQSLKTYIAMGLILCHWLLVVHYTLQLSDSWTCLQVECENPTNHRLEHLTPALQQLNSDVPPHCNSLGSLRGKETRKRRPEDATSLCHKGPGSNLSLLPLTVPPPNPDGLCFTAHCIDHPSSDQRVTTGRDATSPSSHSGRCHPSRPTAHLHHPQPSLPLPLPQRQHQRPLQCLPRCLPQLRRQCQLPWPQWLRLWTLPLPLQQQLRM